MQTIPTISSLRQALSPFRLEGKTIGVVPTMGALHAGHISLIDAAKQECDIVVMTLFVNPTQFNNSSDFAKYPRDNSRDFRIAEGAGVNFVFCPEANEIYPDGFATTVSVSGLTDILEGASRPGHFDGVATVVSKLFNIVAAHKAFFGLKDYQQLQVVKRMTSDLNIPTEIVACPTIRESDGLAMSSRNVRLTPELRAAATVLYRALSGAKAVVQKGEANAKKIEAQIMEVISSEPLAVLDYAAVANANSLAREEIIDPNIGSVALIAAKFSEIRLIDNIKLV